MEVFGVGAEFRADLDREFARWRQDQRARAAPVVFAAIAGKPVENGQGEGRRLARAGLGDTDQIAAGKKFGNGANLDRCRDDMVSVGQRTLYRIGQAEVREFAIGH